MCRRLARLYSESARCLETRQQYRKDLKRLCSWIFFFCFRLKGGHVQVEQSEGEVCTKFAQLCILYLCHFGSLLGIPAVCFIYLYF